MTPEQTDTVLAVVARHRLEPDEEVWRRWATVILAAPVHQFSPDQQASILKEVSTVEP